jgi:hypothetical protein
MEPPVSGYRRIIWRFVGACVVPLALWSAYLYFSRMLAKSSTTVSDYAGLLIAVGAGVAFVATGRVGRGDRVFYSIIYVLMMGITLFMYAFWFVGVVFGDWLWVCQGDLIACLVWLAALIALYRSNDCVARIWNQGESGRDGRCEGGNGRFHISHLRFQSWWPERNAKCAKLGKDGFGITSRWIACKWKAEKWRMAERKGKISDFTFEISELMAAKKRTMRKVMKGMFRNYIEVGLRAMKGLAATNPQLDFVHTRSPDGSVWTVSCFRWH